MRISRKLTALGAFFVVAVAIAGCGSNSIPGNSVAMMSGNPITLQAYKHWMYVAAKGVAGEEGTGAPVITPSDPPKFTSCIAQIRKQVPTLAKGTNAALLNDCKEVFSQYNGEVMNFLIEGYWFQAEAAKLGIKYTPAEAVKDYKNLLKKDFPTKSALQSYYDETGETNADLRYTLRVSGLYAKLEKRYETKITPAQIQKYYDAHKSQYGTAESFNLHLIRTDDTAAGAKAAQEAYNALKSGESWDQVAKTYAADASSKANGGLLTGVVRNEEEKAVNDAMLAAKVNQLLGPIHGLFGYYVLEVVKITPATQEPLKQVSSEIKTALTDTESQNAAAKVLKEARASFGAATTCRAEYQVQYCHNYKAVPTTTTAVTTPATSSTPTTSTSTSTSPTASTTTTTGTSTKTTTTGG